MTFEDNNSLSNDFWCEAEALARAAQVQLEYFQALGLTDLGITIPLPEASSLKRPTAEQKSPGRAETVPRQKSSRSGESKSPPSPSAGPDDLRPAAWAPSAKGLSELAAKTAACQGCALAKTRRSDPVLGRGSNQPLMVFVGPSPDIYDGEAWELLSAMIDKGLKLTESDFYVTTLIRCGLDQEEMNFPAGLAIACLPILHRELTLLNPKIILALGDWPGRLLSGQRNEHLLMLRQRTHAVKGLDNTWLRVTYGLEDLLSTPELKREAWKDLQKIIPVINKFRQL